MFFILRLQMWLKGMKLDIYLKIINSLMRKPDNWLTMYISRIILGKHHMRGWLNEQNDQ